MDKLVNFVLFQIGWFSAVIGGASNRPWLGVLVITAVVLIHLYRTINVKAEAVLIIIIAIMGGSLDSVFVYLNWISYPSGCSGMNISSSFFSTVIPSRRNTSGI